MTTGGFGGLFLGGLRLTGARGRERGRAGAELLVAWSLKDLERVEEAGLVLLGIVALEEVMVVEDVEVKVVEVLEVVVSVLEITA